MESKSKKEGVYLSNFVAMGMSFFILVLAFAAGFFASSYYSGKSATTALGTGAGAGAGTQIAPTSPKTASEIYGLLPEITASDHVKGDRNAEIVLVEYSDFQCPFCARFHPTVKEFLSKNPNVAYVFRHLPLDFHQFAPERAKASECAVKLGGADMFWSYSDVVFGSSDLNNVDLSQVAGQLGLNVAAFNDCVKSNEFDKRISDLSDGGKKFLSAISDQGGYGTPGAVVINRTKKIAEKLAGAVPLSEIESAYNRVK